MKKLLIIIPNLRMGGMERSLYFLLKKMSLKKSEITVWSLFKIESVIIDMIKDLGVTLKTFSIEKVNSFKTIFKIMPLIREVRREKYKLIVCFGFDAELIGLLVKILGGKPALLTTRRDMGDWGRTIRQSGYRKYINPYVNKIIANSHRVKITTIANENANEERIAVISNGLDLSMVHFDKDINGIKKKFGIDSDDKVVILVANYRNRVKGHEFYIKAANEVKKTIKKVKFLIIGIGFENSDYSIYLYGLIKNYDLAGQVIFIPDVDNVYSILNIANICVNVSLSEGMSNAILEYMAMGKPVIATDVGGNPENVINNVTGYIVPASDYLSLTKAIIKLLDNNSLAISMGEKGRERLEAEFTAEKMAQEYENLFLEYIN